jgi:hypothetical protein
MSGTIALSGCLGSENNELQNTVDDTVANVPVPDNPSSFTYARAWTANRPTGA